PAVRIGKDGQTWVAANGGTFGTSAIGLWRITDDCAQNFTFVEPETPLYNGGGDLDVEGAPQKNALGVYNVYTSSLHATDTFGNFNSATSMDGGKTFTVTPISTPNVVDDRQWNAAYGASTIWLSYHSIAGGFNIYVVRSDANGLPGTFVGPYL